MKKLPILILLLIPYFLHAQPKMNNKDYPSLLWEISGKGMTKPSYLFGTMHVSSKLAFHLADSFYIGIRNADVVALETNPESWQEDMSKYELGNNEYGNYRMNYSGMEAPDDYLHMNTLRFYKYDKKIERALYSNPSTINNLLYRSYGNSSSDFEEDTYLDMYIYQCGKKWGKKVAGVEQYGESMKLMAEAYKDAARDKNKKERSYDQEDGYSSTKLQEAYRTGNLDWLDSINKYNSFSSAFDEKFLYRRNEIQAGSIDSILRSGQSLFVGVGAAHLPGNRGVIEILRKQGYRLRPVKMGARDSQHKNQVEKLRVPVSFATQQSDDAFFKVDIPGKFYKFGDDATMDQRQYADMANGSYYMVTRIMTNAWMWGHTTERVKKTVDSLLYENVPGKIVRKTAIVRNGYQGIDLVNKTRRGDVQRYNIFTTPFEVIIFKMSGTGEYVSQGAEAQRFFSSIQLKEFKTQEPAAVSWKKYSPPYGGFSIDLPHEPYIGNDGSWIYDAEDKTARIQYRVIRTDIHNYQFVEEDTFDLGLMEESFAASEFIDTQLSRQQTAANGYPALDCRYKDKDGLIYKVRFIIQGPHYYTLVAHGKQEVPAMQNFMNSFFIKPIIYPAASVKTDTALYYTVKTPVFPVSEKQKLEIPRGNFYQDEDDDNDMEAGVFRSKTIQNDTTGEKIFVSFFKSPRYAYLEDSTILEKESPTSVFGDTTWIIKKKTKTERADKMKIWEVVLTDTGSSRTLWSKTFYKDGVGFSLMTQSDTLSAPSSFIQSFYDSFTPADTLRGNDMFVKKSTLFFQDFMNTDSVVHKRAVKGIYVIKFDSTDIPDLKKAITLTGWGEKNYLDTKKSLIRKMSTIQSNAATAYLKELYQAAGDTLELQYAVLGTLLRQKTSDAYKAFRDIVMAEPPVLEITTRSWQNNQPAYTDRSPGNSLLNGLNDSLKLTRTIIADILPLINLDDYKYPMMSLLGQMVDSGLVKQADYKIYFSRFLLEAKQELKKQTIAEKQKAIQKAEDEKKDNAQNYSTYQQKEDEDGGNENLELYTSLLLPFWDTNPQVPALLTQLLSSADKRLKYSTFIALMRAGKTYPDSLLNYFAQLDEYRYELYEDLSDMDQFSKFPAKANKQLLLANSQLLLENNNAKPDSLLFVDKLKAEIKGREGWVYFFKYKSRKDDVLWKLATVGLLPLDSTKYQWKEDDNASTSDEDEDEGYVYRSKYRLTGFSNTRLRDDEPVLQQLQKELKRMLYSKRKSAKEFYDRSGAADYDEVNITINNN